MWLFGHLQKIKPWIDFYHNFSFRNGFLIEKFESEKVVKIKNEKISKIEYLSGNYDWTMTMRHRVYDVIHKRQIDDDNKHNFVHMKHSLSNELIYVEVAHKNVYLMAHLINVGLWNLIKKANVEVLCVAAAAALCTYTMMMWWLFRGGKNGLINAICSVSGKKIIIHNHEYYNNCVIYTNQLNI